MDFRVLNIVQRYPEESGKTEKCLAPLHAFCFFLVYIYLLSAGSLMPCTLKELGMWLDLGALRWANSKRTLLSDLAIFFTVCLAMEICRSQD
jgi:hypothetical protein